MMSLSDLTLSCGLDAREVSSFIRQFGAAVFPNFAAKSTLEELRSEFRGVLEQPKNAYARPLSYQPGRAVELNRKVLPVEYYQTIRSFFGLPWMRAVADSYMGHLCLLNYELYATHEFIPATDIAPTHHDKLWTLKFMLYMNDIDVDSGAFGVIPGSAASARDRFRDIFEKHSLKHLSMKDPRFSAMENDNVPAELPPVVNIIGAAGTLIVFDSDTYHHAGSVSTGRERMILRGHTGHKKRYRRVRKRSRQWWRGEKRFNRTEAWADRLSDLVFQC